MLAQARAVAVTLAALVIHAYDMPVQGGGMGGPAAQSLNGRGTRAVALVGKHELKRRQQQGQHQQE